MSPDPYIECDRRSAQARMRFAAHMFYLERAKARSPKVDLSAQGSDARSYEGRSFGAKERCLFTCPRDARSSTLVYERLRLVSDNCFLRSNPEWIAMAGVGSPGARARVRCQRYKVAIRWQRNVKRLTEAGVRSPWAPEPATGASGLLRADERN